MLELQSGTHSGLKLKPAICAASFAAGNKYSAQPPSTTGAAMDRAKKSPVEAAANKGCIQVEKKRETVAPSVDAATSSNTTLNSGSVDKPNTKAMHAAVSARNRQ